MGLPNGVIMATSIVDELQRDALNTNVPVTNLLMKAKVIATKLSLDEPLRWIESELKGYPDGDIPPYRKLQGRPMFRHPLYGWQPILSTDQAFFEVMCEIPAGQPIAEIEAIVANRIEARDDDVESPFPGPLTVQLLKMMNIPPLPLTRKVSASSVAGILSAVRKLVLDWSLELEKAGVHGEDLAFSKEEKQIASATSHVFNIARVDNFSGQMGSVHDHAVVNVTHKTKTINFGDIGKLASEIEKYADHLELDDDGKTYVLKKAAEIREESARPIPDMGKIKGYLLSMKGIMENATGGVVAQGIISGIAEILKCL